MQKPPIIYNIYILQLLPQTLYQSVSTSKFDFTSKTYYISVRILLDGGRHMVSPKIRFWILISLVTISGFSQGMLLPLIAIILEKAGVPSSVNGLHATGLYIGILIASPFMEKMMQRLGFKPIILIGGMLVVVSLAFFPVWEALTFWFFLRVLIGIGDQMVHFGTQTWVTTSVPAAKRGRSIALYGLSFALGFTLGPLMTRLLEINESLPFILASFTSLLVLSLMLFVKNSFPEQDMNSAHSSSSLNRFVQTAKIAWVALLPGFGYGFLEATLNGIFPIYGIRIGHEVDIIAIIIPCFALGSIILQFPLGMLSDRFGRRRVLVYALLVGSFCFALAAQLEHSTLALMVLFGIAGMFVGSLFSLGIAYMVDLLPKSLLPAGNLMIGIMFSIGSMSGPFIGGLFIQLFPNLSFFYLMMFMLLIILVSIYLKKDDSQSTRKTN